MTMHELIAMTVLYFAVLVAIRFGLSEWLDRGRRKCGRR